MTGKVHKVTRSYILAICGADNLRPIPIEYGVHVAPHDVNKLCNFCKPDVTCKQKKSTITKTTVN